MSLLPMNAEILPPSDDRLFKLILTSPGAEPVLMDLISSIIGRPVTGVITRNTELPVYDTEEKAERFDVNCKIDDGSQIEIEMQASRIQEDADGEHRNLKGKIVYYLSDLHSSQPAKGLRRYDDLAQTYQVTFCSYTVFPEWKEYANSFSLRHDEHNAQLTDAIRVVIVELSKLDEIIKKSVNDMTDLEKWAVFFQYANEERYRETVNEVIDSKEALQMAGNLLMSVSKDEKERAIFRSRRKYQTDRQSDIATAEDRGEKRKALSIARNALQMGMNIDEVVRLTGLTYDEVKSLV